VGAAPTFLAAVQALRRVGPTDAAVLLLGPSGSGKELFARTLHALSRRRDGAFVAFNCAAVPETLVESELFGHERGAFTGATARHVGRFEQAAGGTLFLDEIAEVPLATQSKLLRAVEEHRVARLGGCGDVDVDVRVVAATNQDLQERVLAGSFRRDLFHRLAVFPISLPALAERREDIPALALHLLARAALRHGLQPPVLAPAAMAALALAPWPGNVRELANLIERSVILANGPTVCLRELGLEPAACREAWRDSQARELATRLAGHTLAELEAFLGPGSTSGRH
jgi:Nif-specific regulatory protein